MCDVSGLPCGSSCDICYPRNTEFVPAACGISRARVYNDPTTRAARKALKSPSLFSGQAQSTRVRALKTCITQVNASERAFNQVTRENVVVCDTITEQILQDRSRDAPMKPPLYNTEYTNLNQPDLSIVTVDPSGNTYNLVNYISEGMNHITVTKYDLALILTGPTLDLSNTLVSANLFWTNNELIFVGIFYSTYTYVRIYTYDPVLDTTLKKEFDTGINNPIRYSGQSTYNSNGYIYVSLAASDPPSEVGYVPASTWCITPDGSSITTTSLNNNYTSIQHCIGDTDGFVFVTARESTGAIWVFVFTNNTVTFVGPQKLFDDVTYCTMTIINTTTVNEGNVAVTNLVVALGATGSTLLQNVMTYYHGEPATISVFSSSAKPITVPWPNFTPYQILGVTLYSNPGADRTNYLDTDLKTPRYFYTLYLYNPTLINFQWYVQYGELAFDSTSTLTLVPASVVPSDSITPPAGTPLPNPTNIQIDSEYNIAPTNISQASTSVLAITNGLRLLFYDINYTQFYQEYIDVSRNRKYCIKKIIYPGCDCPKPPVNNNPPLDSFTHTLDIAICNPIQFTNPPSSEGCAPVYTPPIPYSPVYSTYGESLPPAVPDPPQGPAVQTIFRKYNRINGIDEICKPIPGRYASSRTALIRTNIEVASDTRYVSTDPPLVQFPFPCPVYGNQTGIPRARKCVPTIDGRPGTE